MCFIEKYQRLIIVVEFCAENIKFMKFQGCIFFLGGRGYVQITGWDKKGGEMHIFSPIDLNYTKLRKKTENISPSARSPSLWHAPPHYNKFKLGEKYNSKRRGGGKNMNFNIIYTPVEIHCTFVKYE